MLSDLGVTVVMAVLLIVRRFSIQAQALDDVLALLIQLFACSSCDVRTECRAQVTVRLHASKVDEEVLGTASSVAPTNRLSSLIWCRHCQ